MFHQVIKCLQYYHLKADIKHGVYRGEDYLKKFCKNLKKIQSKGN